MKDYFDLALSSEANKAMMGRFKLEKSAKLWWQDHCWENALDPTFATWEYIKTQLCKNYQSRTYQIERLNEFLDCSQGKDTLNVLYQRFLKLLKYAPAEMTQEAKVARFVSKLNPPMDTRLQSLRLSTFADVLDAGRPIEQEVDRPTIKDFKPQQPKGIQTHEVPFWKREADHPPQRQPEPRQRLPPHLYEKAKREHLCLECMDPNHQIKDCLFNDTPSFSKPKALPWNGSQCAEELY